MQKVLIIAYYWPPAGGPGVQRWLKFVKYLGDYNIEPIVYVPENPTYPITDTSLLNDIPDAIRVLKQPIFEPYGLASIFSKKKTRRISSGIIQKKKKQSLLERTLLWLRGNLFIPDARKYWVKPSIKYLSKYIEDEKINTVITTGPPHSIHLIGSSVAQKKHKKLEGLVLNTADKIIVTSSTTKKEFSALTQKPIKVITNGYDEELPKCNLDDKFTISHIGSLLTDRNPEKLWKVLAELVDEKVAFKDHLQIQLVGLVGKEVIAAITKNGLSSFTKELGYISHDEVVQLQPKSQVLLLVEIDAEETKGIIPGKLFEYLNAKRPILAIGPKDWEAAKIIKETNSGIGLVADDEIVLKNVLLEWFKLFQKGALESNSSGIEKYSRKELTNQLANFIRWESS